VIVFAPHDDRPVGFNVMQWQGPGSGIAAELIADQVVYETFKRVWGDVSWGPQMEQMMRNVARTILYAQHVPPEHRPTLTEFVEVVGLYDASYRDYLLAHIEDHYNTNATRLLLKFWHEFDHLSDRRKEEKASSTINKAEPLAVNEFVSYVVGQGQLTRLDFQTVVDENKILLVDLDVNQLGSGNVEVLGSLVVGRLFIAALSRNLRASTTPFHIIADEFGFFATPAFAALQDQVRKFKVDVVVAHQRRGQLDTETKGATRTAGNLIVFSVNSEDAKDLAPEFDRRPPEPEVRGQREPLGLASNPWNTLKQRSHELTEVMDLVHYIDAWLVEKVIWNQGSLYGPQVGLDADDEVFRLVSFITPAAKERFEKALNRVLYLMLTGSPGEDWVHDLVGLGNSLFTNRYRTYIGGYEPIEGDPRLTPDDWGEVAVEKLERAIQGWTRHHTKDGQAAFRELVGVYVRIRTRYKVVGMIAELGVLLRDNPVWARGGQPQPDYEPRQTVMDYTAFRENALTQLPRYEAWVRIQDEGEWHILTPEIPGPPPHGWQMAEAIRQQSRARYGVDKKLIDQALMERVQIEEEEAPQMEAEEDLDQGEIVSQEQAEEIKSRFHLSL
jgi:hypothetical protein